MGTKTLALTFPSERAAPIQPAPPRGCPASGTDPVQAETLKVPFFPRPPPVTFSFI